MRYNIDSIISEQKPTIVFRGKEYSVRDMTVKETIQSIRNAKKREEKLNAKQKNRIREEVIADGFPEEEVEDEVEKRLSELSLEDIYAEYLPIAVEALVRALEDFPKEVAESLTVTEYKVLRTALEEINSKEYDIVLEENTKKKN